MKKTIILVLLTLATIFAVSCSATEDIQENTTQESTQLAQEDAQATQETEYDFGSKSALERDELTLEEMLAYAIQDEYFARQEYELIMDEYGEQRPFDNIIKAEVSHIEYLTDLYDDYGYDMPEDDAIDYVVLPESLEEAFAVGVQAEIDNIAMYEKFLENDLPDDIREVFIILRDGSVNHLAAFERGVRGNGQGRG